MSSGRDLEWRLRGQTEENWNSSNLTHLLNENTLPEIKQRFSFLDSSVKHKILFSFLGASKRKMPDLKDGIGQIIELAQKDDDEWVRVIADFFRDFAERQALYLNIEDKHSSFRVSLENLKKECKIFFPLFFFFKIKL